MDIWCLLADLKSFVKIKCENHGIHASSAPAQKCHGLQKTLFLCEDAKVVLTINVNNRFHLFNCSVGKVDIVYGPGRSPKDGFPAYILVDFPNFTGPAIIPEHPTYVAVPVVQRRVECNYCSPKQLPLRLGWGSTIHKCQGMNIGQGSNIFGIWNHFFMFAHVFRLPQCFVQLDDVSKNSPAHS